MCSCASVGELGFDSFVEEEDHIQAFIPANLWNESLLEADMFQPMFEMELGGGINS